MILSIHILALRRPSSPTSLFVPTRTSTAVSKSAGGSGSGGGGGSGVAGSFLSSGYGVGGGDQVPKMLPAQHFRHHSIPAASPTPASTPPFTLASGPTTNTQSINNSNEPPAIDNYTLNTGNPALAAARQTIIGRLAAACNQGAPNNHQGFGNESGSGSSSIGLLQQQLHPPRMGSSSLSSSHASNSNSNSLSLTHQKPPLSSSKSNASPSSLPEVSVAPLLNILASELHNSYTPTYPAPAPAPSPAMLQYRSAPHRQTPPLASLSTVNNAFTTTGVGVGGGGGSSTITNSPQRYSHLISHQHNHHPHITTNNSHAHQSAIARPSFTHSAPHSAMRLSCKSLTPNSTETIHLHYLSRIEDF